MVILAAVSGEYHQDRVVEVGYDLASTYGDELVVLHVMTDDQFAGLSEGDISSRVAVPSEEESQLAYVSGEETVSEYNIEDAETDSADVARDCMEGTLDGHDRATVTARGRVGDPATEIVDEAERTDARFVVVGGRQRTPVGKAVFGSVSQSVILDSTRPVVTITRDAE